MEQESSGGAGEQQCRRAVVEQESGGGAGEQRWRRAVLEEERRVVGEREEERKLHHAVALAFAACKSPGKKGARMLQSPN